MIRRKLSFLVRARHSKSLDRAENAAETLDASYDQQLEVLQQVKRARPVVVAAKLQLEAQGTRLRALGRRLEDQARQALADDREELARQVLERRAAALAEAAADAQAEALQTKEDELAANEHALAERLARFRGEKETLKANYAAAKAMVEIGEAATGLGQGMTDVGIAVQRARDRTEELEARAAALDELVAAGTLESAGAPTELDRELASLSSRGEVDAELSRLKTEAVQK